MKDDKKIYSLSKEERVKLAREFGGFVCKESWFSDLRANHVEYGKMTDATLFYFFEQKEPKFHKKHLQIAWEIIKEDLDEQLEHFYLTGEKIEEYFNNNFLQDEE